MKFGYNLIALEKHISVWMEHIRVWVTLKFSKCFKITHTHSLNLRDHVPNISTTMVYGMGVWGGRMGGVYM